MKIEARDWVDKAEGDWNVNTTIIRPQTMEPGTRDQGSQALQEFQRRHDNMRGAIAVGRFELQ